MTQVVYNFAKKQHSRRIEEAVKEKQEDKENNRDAMERRKWEIPESSSQSNKSWAGVEVAEKQVEAPWDPPKVMMVNQLWMWIIDGG